jgi:hypothetical protein
MAELGAEREDLTEAALGDACEVCLAELSRADFYRARRDIPDLRAFASFEDWRDHCDCMEIGLAAAGAVVLREPVVFDGFAQWLAAQRFEGSLTTLDLFAEAVHRFRSAPDAPLSIELVVPAGTRARAGRQIADLGDETQAFIPRVGASGHAASCRLAVPLADFLDWSQCLSLRPNVAALRRYARLRLEWYADPF